MHSVGGQRAKEGAYAAIRACWKEAETEGDKHNEHNGRMQSFFLPRGHGSRGLDEKGAHEGKSEGGARDIAQMSRSGNIVNSEGTNEPERNHTPFVCGVRSPNNKCRICF